MWFLCTLSLLFSCSMLYIIVFMAITDLFFTMSLNIILLFLYLRFLIPCLCRNNMCFYLLFVAVYFWIRLLSCLVEWLVFDLLN